MSRVCSYPNLLHNIPNWYTIPHWSNNNVCNQTKTSFSPPSCLQIDLPPPNKQWLHSNDETINQPTGHINDSGVSFSFINVADPGIEAVCFLSYVALVTGRQIERERKKMLSRYISIILTQMIDPKRIMEGLWCVIWYIESLFEVKGGVSSRNWYLKRCCSLFMEYRPTFLGEELFIVWEPINYSKEMQVISENPREYFLEKSNI